MSAVPETGTTRATNTFPRVGVRATRKATIIAFFAWLFAVFDYIMFGTLLPQIASSFGWTDATASLVSTFVSVGTHRHPFDRLLALVDRAVEEAVLPEPVVAQSGTCGYSPRHYRARRMLSQDEVLDAVERAQYVVCHAGSGIISAALRTGHKPLVLARRRPLAEHVDNHQEQIVRKLSELDLIVTLDGRITEAHLAAASEGARRASELSDGLPVSDVLERELLALSRQSA